MHTSSPTFTRIVFPLAFVALCAALAIVLWKSFGGSLPLDAKRYEVTVRFPQASNLFANADVRIAGVDVGRVTGVRRTAGGAEATLSIDPKFVPLRANAGAILRTKTLLGETYVQLDPGPRSARAIPDRGRLSSRRVVPAQRLDDVLTTFGPETRRDLRALFAGAATAFEDRSGSLSGSIARSAPTVESLSAVLRTANDQHENLRRGVASAATVVAAVGGRRGELQAAVTAVSDVLDVTGHRDRDVAATIRALPPFLREVRGAAGSLTRSSGEIRAAASALRETSPTIVPALRSLQSAAPELQRVFADLPPVLRTGGRTLPALDGVLDAARTELPSIDTATRQLTPVFRLLGDNRSAVIGVLANVGQIQNGTIVGPGNKVIHYGNGLPTFWNEVVGGWIKRLPTNRLNPYPKPDSLNDITTGVLKSYDCRHLGNNLYLPAFGGTPPCLTQGPWTFDGRSAYFPRLQEAPTATRP